MKVVSDHVLQSGVAGLEAQSAALLQVLSEMGDKNVTLASMHSISKGFYGECGRRGGYLELVNVSSDVVSEFYKLASINLCSNLNGQICMALVMNPPKVPTLSLLQPPLASGSVKLQAQLRYLSWWQSRLSWPHSVCPPI